MRPGQGVNSKEGNGLRSRGSPYPALSHPPHRCFIPDVAHFYVRLEHTVIKKA
jgi:hypothetical protein